jgi:NAD(P)-dependent dehydrogenase (short-subunit alcohol dehydrogenase family)
MPPRAAARLTGPTAAPIPPDMSSNHASRRYLVTGASSGIGLALARRLAGRGAQVLCTGRRAVAGLPADFPDCAYLQADLAQPGGARRVADWAEGPLDAAILNAGAGYFRPLGAETPADIAAVIATNFAAPVALAHALYPALAVAGGRLGLVGSVARRGAAGMPVYSASKAALDGFGRALAAEWAGRVTVRVLHPGPTATGMSVRAGRMPDLADRLMLPPDLVAAALLAAFERPRGGFRRTISYPQCALHRLIRGRA